ncbi:holo-ACP synthase [Paenibacillus sediminis]|uniref:Holo-[acyl-carrier-protein] synthase n=1 Tax=Paenibacillus sediminis TaxID=664909 RepID=A0ABS4H675_9BACL|nr:holo-ACP synthase [Paenibacillus sediminis]MBP1938025.1 holo-[acyl-carrier protein] synthase [Paenibacillus sediminis]
MIYGIGHDVLEIKRVELLMNGPYGDKFMERILTGAEQELAKQRGSKVVEFLAGRFSAKEAVAKAFGSGIGKIIGFKDIEILPDDSGKPIVKLSEHAWERLRLPDEPQYIIHLSISHQTELASTFVVVEKNERRIHAKE